MSNGASYDFVVIVESFNGIGQLLWTPNEGTSILNDQLSKQLKLCFDKPFHYLFLVVSIFLCSIGNVALAEIFDHHPNAKGLKVEAPRPKGYIAEKVKDSNHVFQWGKESGRGQIFWLQLSIYEMPKEVVSKFSTIEPLEWAKLLIDNEEEHIISAENVHTNYYHTIDIVYDHTLYIENEKWRNRNLIRMFEASGRMVVVECIVAAPFTNQGTPPPVSFLAELYSQHLSECKAMLDGVSVSK